MPSLQAVLRHSFLLSILSLLLSPVPGAASESTTYTVYLMGNEAGTQVVTPTETGLQITYEFNDRGRGPKLDSKIVLNDRGIPLSVTTDGNDDLKGNVSERFTVLDRVATWQNKGGKGSASFNPPAFYISMNGTPAETALLANALLAARDSTLSLLPAGVGRAEVVDTVELEAGGNSRRVRQVEIAGVDFALRTVWLNEDGSLFGLVSDSLTIIEQGWSETIEQLLQKQDEALAAQIETPLDE